MKPRWLALMLSLAAASAAPATTNLDRDLLDREWLLQVMLYSYHWYLDDAFFAAFADRQETEVWVRSVEPPNLDAGDRSRFGEIWLPDVRVLLSVKRSDYVVPELDLPVQSRGYRVRRGSFESSAPGNRDEWTILKLNRHEVSEALKSARRQVHVPEEDTKQVVLALLRRELAKDATLKEPQRFSIAARTGVATDVWVFWHNRRVLLQVSGDMDITHPELVPHLPLLVRQFALASNVVASLIEAEGSNSYISRDKASRVLFLCLARGEEITIDPASH